MIDIVKNILKSSKNKEAIEKELDKISHDVEVARGVLSGKYQYCKDCDDYYLAKSFLTESETVDHKILTYDDPINSGGNEYEDGYLDTLYRVCPKGHREVISESERRKV